MNGKEEFDFYYEGFNVRIGKIYGIWRHCTMHDFNILMHDYYIEGRQWIECVERIDAKRDEVKVIFKRENN